MWKLPEHGRSKKSKKSACTFSKHLKSDLKLYKVFSKGWKLYKVFLKGWKLYKVFLKGWKQSNNTHTNGELTKMFLKLQILRLGLFLWLFKIEISGPLVELSCLRLFWKCLSIDCDDATTILWATFRWTAFCKKTVVGQT